MLTQMDTELRAIRSLCYRAAFARSLARLAEDRLKTDVSAQETRELRKIAKQATKELREYTPLIKYWVGEQSVVQARRAVQILGGYGYTTDYRAEWWVRESLIYSLYEGTSQIQALMCMKDTLKEVMAQPRAWFARTAQNAYHRLSDPSPLRRKLYGLLYQQDQAVYKILLELVKKNFKLSFHEKDWIKKLPQLAKEMTHFSDLTPALAHAERFCELKCYTTLAETLVKDAEMDEERKVYAERFFVLAIPKVAYLRSCIESKKRITSYE
jgi:hypothetical protein